MEISEFVSVIASHPSPEGMSVVDNEDEVEDDQDENDLVDIDESDSSVSSQYVLSFSWRAVKETSSLLEMLIKIYSSRVSKEQVQCVSNTSLRSSSN